MSKEEIYRLWEQRGDIWKERALRAEAAPLAIVREIAASDPMIAIHMGEGEEEQACRYCDHYGEPMRWENPRTLVYVVDHWHYRTCLFVRSCEIVARLDTKNPHPPGDKPDE